MEIYKKQEKLIEYIKEPKQLCIAFSAGVDSTYLLAVAHSVIKDGVMAVTVRSSMYPKVDMERAKSFAAKIGVKHIVIDADEYDYPEFVQNNDDRCYHCKKNVFTRIIKVAESNGIDKVADGSNADDVHEYRPGALAIAELGVLSPLKFAQLTKAEIRELSRGMGLETADTPSGACLATRLPYGTEITPERLLMIEKAEEYVRSLGVNACRVRYHGDIARVEVKPSDFLQILDSNIVAELKKIGFLYITLDMQGLRSGSMDEARGRQGI